jgi:hypothetical protein
MDSKISLGFGMELDGILASKLEAANEPATTAAAALANGRLVLRCIFNSLIY